MMSKAQETLISNTMDVVRLSHYVTCVFCQQIDHKIFQTNLEEFKTKDGREITKELMKFLAQHKGWKAAKLSAYPEDGFFPCCPECASGESMELHTYAVKLGSVTKPIFVRDLI